MISTYLQHSDKIEPTKTHHLTYFLRVKNLKFTPSSFKIYISCKSLNIFFHSIFLTHSTFILGNWYIHTLPSWSFYSPFLLPIPKFSFHLYISSCFLNHFLFCSSNYLYFGILMLRETTWHVSFCVCSILFSILVLRCQQMHEENVLDTHNGVSKS